MKILSLTCSRETFSRHGSVRRMRSAATILTLTMAGAWLVFGQGSLTPPGAPGPTMKTLEQIEPRTVITNLPYTILGAGGSYYLTNHMTGVAASDGILILTDNVTVDLNGYSLIGVPGSYNGIIAVGTRRNLVLRNGTVRNWGNRGVSAGSASSSQGQGLRALNNTLDGLTFGDHSTLSDCTTYSNGWAGIRVGTGSVIDKCTATSNIGTGIYIGASCTIRSSAAVANSYMGIVNATGCTISDCTAALNGGYGIWSRGPSTTIQASNVSSNGGFGIVTGEATIIACTARNNGQAGISGNFGCTIHDCASAYNDTFGISVNHGCHVEGNTCYNNRLSGIDITGSGNRIDSNNVNDNGTGIRVGYRWNLIIRNSASGNTTNFSFRDGIGQPTAQTYGSTNKVDGLISTTNPWDNFGFGL